MRDAPRRVSAPRDDGDRNAPAAELPYVIELWDLARAKVERIVARADTALVAGAIFRAAAAENPLRRVVLRQGSRIIDEQN